MTDDSAYMKADAGLTLEQLRAALNYDPTTGVFVNRKTGRHLATRSGRYGRIQIHVCGRGRYAARLAWFYMHGEWPQGQVDHINGDHTDNRLVNLRVVTNAANAQNKSRPRVDNSTGMLGVSHDKRTDRYRARIMANGKMVSLGYYDTPEAAHEAYREAKRTLHPSWVEAA